MRVDDASSSEPINPEDTYPGRTLRPRAHPSQRFTQLRSARNRARLSNSMANEEMDTLLELHNASDRLAQVNEDLRHMMERHDYVPGSYSPIASTHPPPSDMPSESRRKRRKVDNDKVVDARPNVSYGYEGRVASGRLNMQLVSSDGGVVETPAFLESGNSPRGSHSKHGAANVLQDDESVYCTSSSRCNMVFRHQGQLPFTLEKLVIKAPRSNYTDPVQEGLVFVSMSKDEIFDRTKDYHIFHFPSSRFGHYFTSTRRNGQSPSQEPSSFSSLPPLRSLTREDIWPPLARTFDADADAESTDSPDESTDDDESVDLTVARRADTADSILYDRWAYLNSSTHDLLSTIRGDDAGRDEYGDMLAQQDFDEILRRGAFTSEDRRRRRIDAPLRDIERIERLERRFGVRYAPPAPTDVPQHPTESSSREPRMTAGNSSSDEEPLENPSALDVPLLEPNARFKMLSPAELRRKGRRRLSRHLKRIEARIESTHPHPDENIHFTIAGTSDKLGLPSSNVGDVFHDTIDDNPVTFRHVRTTSTSQSDSKITIRFDPPISARFVLLKLWNPKASTSERTDRRTGNIDIESVQAFGWAGPRLFPSVEMR